MGYFTLGAYGFYNIPSDKLTDFVIDTADGILQGCGISSVILILVVWRVDVCSSVDEVMEPDAGGRRWGAGQPNLFPFSMYKKYTELFAYLYNM